MKKTLSLPSACSPSLKPALLTQTWQRRSTHGDARHATANGLELKARGDAEHGGTSPQRVLSGNGYGRKNRINKFRLLQLGGAPREGLINKRWQHLDYGSKALSPHTLRVPRCACYACHTEALTRLPNPDGPQPNPGCKKVWLPNDVRISVELVSN